jgi:hypothetical protein
LNAAAAGRTVWLFDLDNTLHDASSSAFRLLDRSMSDYIQQALRMTAEEADQLRRNYWRRYGATLLGLIRHHGVKAPHFLEQTHRMPGLEALLKSHPHDLAALRRLPGRKYILTNAPRAYTERWARWASATCSTAWSPSKACACSVTGAPSRMRACSAAWRPGCVCIRPSACWSRTRWSTRRRRMAWAFARCGCSAG